RADDVAVLDLQVGARLGPRPIQQSAVGASEVTEQLLDEILEVGARGGRTGPLGCTGGGGSFDGGQALVELLEAGGDLLAELVHRRSEAGRVDKAGELRGITIEVGPEQDPDPADRAVALSLVEQLADELPQLAAI